MDLPAIVLAQLPEIAPRDVVGVILTFLALAAFLGVMWLLVLAVVLRRMTVGRDRSQLEALRAAPLVLVLLIDAIDLGLDFLGAPLVWLIMSRSELRSLRGLSVAESLIPGTQLIPTMTISWLYARSRMAERQGRLDEEGAEAADKPVARDRPIG